MANITMFVASLSCSNNKVRIDGVAFVNPGSDGISWTCEAPFDTIAFDVNLLMRDAAIAAVTDAGHHVSATDKKTLLCPAVDL